MSSVTQIIKDHKYILLLLVITSLVTLSIKFPLASRAAEVTTGNTEHNPKLYAVGTAATISIPVSGMVKATNHVVVRAKTAGEVINIYAREGTTVEQGQLLARQNTPIENAQYELASAQGALSSVQNAAMVSGRQTASAEQSVVALTAREVALLRQSGNSAGVTESVKQLAVTLDGAITNLSATLDFVDQHKPLFTADGMNTYRGLVAALYNRQPNFLSGSVQYSIKSPADIIQRLQESKDTGIYDATEMQAIGVLVEAQMNALTELLATGEKEIFDVKKVASNDPVYTQYLTSRQTAITTAGLVQSAMAGVRSALSSTNEDLLQQGKSVTVTEADAKEAIRQVDFAEAVARASAVVSNSSMGVITAQISLGNATAPFSGTVSRVEVEVGEYVQPGSPILTLVGTAGKELEVTVPATFVNHLKAGQEFISHDKVVGYVSRFSTVAEKGSVQVVIELIAEELAVGDSIAGNISVAEGVTDGLSLPRAYVHFTSAGAMVNTNTNERISVAIVYDYGETVFIRGNLKPGMKVLPTISGSF